MEALKFSNDLIKLAVQKNWQDISFFPEETTYRIVYRQGSCSKNFRQLAFSDGEKIISRFKYLGEMDVAEKRRAQLGSCTYQVGKLQQRLRLSSVGDYRQRESLVIRLLFRSGAQQSHYAQPALPELLKSQMNKRGLYLFAGPVGSGKTTLMYDIASRFTGQVITIEDPVEIEEPTFLQLQINEKIEQTYDALIQLSLRHHPDILIIGEILNRQTAQAAIRAALTGHLVFATLHARSLKSILPRMIELSQKEAELKESLQGVVYQEMFSYHKHPIVVCGYQFFSESNPLSYSFAAALSDFNQGACHGT